MKRRGWSRVDCFNALLLSDRSGGVPTTSTFFLYCRVFLLYSTTSAVFVTTYILNNLIDLPNHPCIFTMVCDLTRSYGSANSAYSPNHASIPSPRKPRTSYESSDWVLRAQRLLKLLFVWAHLRQSDRAGLILADMIDSKNQEIRPASDDVYTKMEDLADEMPESSPRFILLSYPLTMVRMIS